MCDVGVPFEVVYANCTSKTGNAGNQRRFVEGSRRPSIPGTDRYQNTRGCQTAAEAGPIVSNERDEVRIESHEVATSQSNECKILRHEHARRTDHEDAQSGSDHAEPGCDETPAPHAGEEWTCLRVVAAQPGSRRRHGDRPRLPQAEGKERQ